MIETKGKVRHFADFALAHAGLLRDLKAEINFGPHDAIEVVCPEEHAERLRMIMSDWILGEKPDVKDLKVFEGLGD